MASRRAPDFQDLIRRVSRTLRESNIPFMLIGGQVVLLHGEPRLTQGIDVTLGVPSDRVGPVVDSAREAGLVPLPEDPESFVRETFVLPVGEPSTGLRVDYIFSTTPYEAQAIRRAVHVEMGSESIPFAAVEDLILHKLFAGRPRDIEDVAGVVRRKGPEIDWDDVERWAEEFAEIPGREGMQERIAELRGGV